MIKFFPKLLRGFTQFMLLTVFGTGIGFPENSVTPGDSSQLENRLKVLLDMCYRNPDSARIGLRNFLLELDGPHYNYFHGKALNIIGISFDVSGQYDSAFHYYQEALLHAYAAKVPKLQAAILNNIGLIHWNRGNYEEAAGYFFRSLSNYEALGLSDGVANNLSNLALLAAEVRDYKKAISLQKKAIYIYEKLRKTHNIAIGSSNLGLFYEKLNRPDSSRRYLYKALALHRQHNDFYGIAIACNDLGAFYLRQNQLDSALFYFQIAEGYLEFLGNPKLQASNHASLGRVYAIKNQPGKAEYHLLKSYNLARQHQLEMPLLLASERLAELYAQRKHFEKATTLYKEAFELYKKVYDAERIEKIANLEKRFQTERQQKLLTEKENQLLKQKYALRSRNFLLALSACAVLGITLFFIMQYRRLRRTEEEHKRLELEKQRSDISRELHDNIGTQLTSFVMILNYLKHKHPEPELDRLVEHVRQTIRDLRQTVKALEMTAYPAEKLCHDLKNLILIASQSAPDVQFEASLQCGNRSLPPLTGIHILRFVQEALSNVLRHSQASKCRVEVKTFQNKLYIQVMDNGVGFVPDETTEGSGLLNMKSRIEALSGNLEIRSLPGQGTTLSACVEYK
jgi:signal transduction histidine kinase